jgi:phosphatidylinositol alpha-1,6-mannosyltransferase
MDLKDKKVLITVGRLVKRKGVAWFIQNVMPKLENNYVYLIAGGGPEESNIEQSINYLKAEHRIKMLGKVSDHDLKVLYNTADVFVMPNIKIEGDMEGFGIVAIEASSAGLPIVSSSIEGIKDAIVENQSGELFTEKSEAEAIRAIKKTVALNRCRVKQSIAKFSWGAIGEKYLSSL